ncbi:MAG: hypothetical protein ACR2IK_04465 [Chloroflexota bacterium]
MNQLRQECGAPWLLQYSTLVDIHGLDRELGYIRRDNGTLRIGALARHYQLQPIGLRTLEAGQNGFEGWGLTPGRSHGVNGAGSRRR